MILLQKNIENLKDKFDGPAVHNYFIHIKELALLYGTRILLALVILIIGLWIIRMMVKGFRQIMHNRDVDTTLRLFLASIVSIILKILLFLTVASIAGIQTTGFIAALGAAGLAVGLALQGSLSNFAGGMLILLFKPFKVGDFIAAQNGEGRVDEINVLYTILVTPDNKKVIIPNGVLSNNLITNYSAEDTRRVELSFPVAFGDDLTKAIKIVHEAVNAQSLIITEPPPIIAIDSATEIGSKLIALVWTKRTNYWEVRFSLNKTILEAFREEGFIGPTQFLKPKV